jgi:hypothetical protein
LFGDLVEADVCAGPGESQLGNPEDALAVVLRVGARFSGTVLGFLSHHKGAFLLPIKRYLQAETISAYCVAEMLSVLAAVIPARQRWCPSASAAG